VVKAHALAYRQSYPERFEERFGPLRPVVHEVLEKYLACGQPEYGMARIRCASCGYDTFLPFSCKTRYFCPSCTQKRSRVWGEWLCGRVLRCVPHRHWVLTIPRILRPLFCRERRLLQVILDAARDAFLEGYARAGGGKPVRPGVVLALQTFGELINWHPHVHALVTEGGFDESGTFHPLYRLDPGSVMLLFRERIFEALLAKRRISERLVWRMRHWRHSGFSAHREGRLEGGQVDALQRVARYLGHPSFSEERIRTVPQTGAVIYRCDRIHAVRKRNFEVFDGVGFLHQLCLHIPDSWESLVRYLGFYASAARGKRRKDGAVEPLGLDMPDDGGPPVFLEDPSGPRRSRSWARMIRRVYGVDPLLCPRCQGQMRIIAFILDPDEIAHILRHLRLLGRWAGAEGGAPAGPARASPLLDTLLARKTASAHLKGSHGL